MKNNIIWAKTLLSVYRYLERISGAIDKIILQNGLGSGKFSYFNYFQNNTASVAQRIIDLSERKVTLINLKVLVEDTLREIGQKDAEILIQRFFDGVKFKDIVESQGISLRTVFRRVDNAVKVFSNKLVVKGFNADKLGSMLEKEGWINCVYERLSEKNVEEFSLSSVFLAKAVSM